MKNYFDENDENLKWEQGEAKVLLSTVVADITSRHCKSKTGVEGDYIVMDAPDWVIVVARKDKKFLMVKQWRHGSSCLSVEFPGGVIDKGEEPEAAARRELREETGCEAESLVKIGCINPNPALFNNHVHIFFADDLKAAGKQDLDNDEFINMIELSEDEILEGMGTEQFPHAIMGTAFACYLKYKKLGK